MDDDNMMGADKASQKSKKSVEEQLKYQDHEYCCCCVCQCQTEKTRDLGCCGCFPIKCGVVTIGIVTFILFLALFVEIFYCLLNEYDDWWYVLVGLILLIPMIIACCFFIVFYADECDSTRNKLKVSCMLVIISITLVATWNTCYFYFLYKYPDVYTGSPDTGYLKQTKKQYIVWSLVLGAAIDAIYSYFLCVCITYKDAVNESLEEEDFFKVPSVPMPEVPGVGGMDDEKKDDEKKDEGEAAE
jgi:hypothetical protein